MRRRFVRRERAPRKSGSTLPQPRPGRTGRGAAAQRSLALALVAVIGPGLAACGEAPAGMPSSAASALAAPLSSVSTPTESSSVSTPTKKTSVSTPTQPLPVSTLAGAVASAGTGDDATVGERQTWNFRLVVKTGHGDIAVPIAPLNVASHELVDPPLRDWRSSGTPRPGSGRRPIQSVHRTATTYVYGICRDLYRECAFNDLRYAHQGDVVIVTAPERTLTYVIEPIDPYLPGVGQLLAALGFRQHDPGSDHPRHVRDRERQAHAKQPGPLRRAPLIRRA